MLGGLIWGFIADKWHCHRTVVALACLISLLCIITQPTLSVYYGNTETNRCPAYNNLEFSIQEFNSQNISINNCSSNTRNSLDKNKTIGTNVINCTLDKQHNAVSPYSSSSHKDIIYGSMFFINFLFAFGQGCGVAFVDTATLRHSQLSPEDRPVQYGRQRMFAPVGSVVGILTTNLVIDYFPYNNDITCYAGIFAMYGFFTVLYSVSAIILYGGLTFRDRIDDAVEGDNNDNTSSMENGIHKIDDLNQENSKMDSTTFKNNNFHKNDNHKYPGKSSDAISTIIKNDNFKALPSNAYDSGIGECIDKAHKLKPSSLFLEHNEKEGSKPYQTQKEEVENEENLNESELNSRHQLPAAVVSFKENERCMQELNENNFRKDFIKTFSQYDVLFFYLTVLVSGLEYSQFTSFLFVYLKEMDASSSLLTLSIVFSNVASFVCLAYTNTIIKVLGGTLRTIAFTFLAYFVRYFGISLIRNPWLVLIFQPFHGITATLFMASGMLHLRDTSPLQVLTTLVSIFNGMHFGLGTFIGSSISGVVYERYGGRVLFRSTALLSVGWFCVLVVYILFKENFLRRKGKHNDDYEQ